MKPLTSTNIWTLTEVRNLADEGKISLTPCADTRHEDAIDWYEDYSYYVLDADGVQHMHPVCGWSEVDEFEPRNAAEERLLEVARDVKGAAEAIEDALDEAVAAYERGDLDGVLAALDEAYEIERPHGDAPATQALMRQLLSVSY